MKRSIFRVLRRLAVVAVTVASLSGTSFGQLIYQETFEGDDSGYDIGEESYAEVDPDLDWSPGIWGLNTIGEQIGLQ